MSKSSTVTARAQPLAHRTSVSGAFQIHSDTFAIDTTNRIELFDLTERITALVRSQHVQEGLAHVFSMHTTCAVFINEFQSALLADIQRLLEQVVARDADWLHNSPAHSDCDRFNADSHLRAMLLGQSLTVPVSGGEVVLGQWQRVLMAELDGPRSRTIRVSVMGV